MKRFTSLVNHQRNKPTRFAILKRQPSVGKDVVKLEFSNIADGNVKGCSHSGK